MTYNMRNFVMFVTAVCILFLFKVAQNSFQHLYWMGRYNHSLALDATIMVSKNFSIISELVQSFFGHNKLP